jgi:hypothetical protein
LEVHGWHACVLHPFYYWPVNKCLIADRLPSMTFCGPAYDTVLTNRQTKKLNFDTNYRTKEIKNCIYFWIVWVNCSLLLKYPKIKKSRTQFWNWRLLRKISTARSISVRFESNFHQMFASAKYGKVVKLTNNKII